ncbi:MarR family winged helix-turn-helix transcriptional regulator [Rhizobium mayense]|uniref:MarR family winged helix-turn-helix transcriptional regulator n=1 Tax=Rhizobium mayense TaxID=1312184 RepID=A0ABT7JN50_9HYPH|nr:MarR family winged helix-turn-helix transcriptional regulator [Rhizobium mayense]MDL2397776.1 MarR family winged helix-turn-helix transcriptional regulator [Rhizobium mayense]
MNKNQSLPWDHPRFRSWIAVARACQLMQQSLGRALVHLDIKPPHLDILVNLFRFEGISQRELARKLLVGRSNMSMLLPQMEKRGLIERRGDKHDKRVLRLYLTEEGRRVTLEAMAIQTDLIDRMLSDAPLDECDIMTAHMERIVSLLLQEEREPLEVAEDQ